MQATTYAMCGLAFSGKSTAARRIADELGIELISLDAINRERGLNGGDGIPDEEWTRTHMMAIEKLEAILSAGRSAVVDDTFSHRFLRDRCRSVAERSGSRFVLLFMDTSIDVIRQRRAANDLHPTRDTIRDDVFAAHRDRFQYPQPDEAAVRLVSDARLSAWITAEKASGSLAR